MPINSNEIPAFLPIEHLKWWPHRFVPQAIRVFKSSGTGKTARSESRFSTEGLACYEATCLKGFADTLQYFDLKLEDTEGISLIPSVHEWPDSSLAHMLGAISKHCLVEYAKPEQLLTLLGLRSLSTKGLWLFATNYQWLALCKSFPKLSLPLGSLIFETGGSKGLGEDLSISEVKRIIADHFSIPTSHVISEYGMCELASQAYDTGEYLGQRTYRFAPEIKLSVADEFDCFHDSGRGCLVINDTQRLDLPQPIRTQDDVVLFPNQTFLLNGRLVGAPIKGCSLNALPLNPRSIVKQTAPELAAPPAWNYEDWLAMSETRSERCAKISKVLLPKFVDEITLLSQEFQSYSDAERAIADVIASVPQDIGAWESALERACFAQSVSSIPYRWLFIPPHNHSIAMIYPMLFAVAAGFHMRIRLPPLGRQGLPWLHAVLSHMAGLFDKQVRLVNAEFRIEDEQSDVQYSDKVFLFGSNTTINSLNNISPIALQAYGERICFGLISQASISSLIDQIALDCFAMQQRGCMSLRYLYIVKDGSKSLDLESFANQLSAARVRMFASCNGQQIKTALLHEARRYEYTTSATPYLSSECLLVEQAPNTTMFDPTLLSTAPGVLIVHQVDSAKLETHLATTIASHQSLNLGLADPSYVHLLQTVVGECRSFGNAHRYPWDGLYQGRPLFC